MKLLLLSVLSFLFTANTNISNGPTSTPIKIDESKVEWVGKKVTGQHSGDIALKSGDITFEDGRLTGGTFVLDMTSINTTDLKGGGAAKLNGHLKSDDFFGVANHPTATLEIKSATPASEADTYNVSGELTIKGITKPITFQAVAGSNMAKADIAVDRTLYDIKYGSGSFFDGLGDKMIYNVFEISVTLAY